MSNFLHTYSPQPILFQLGPIKIHWYGFLMVIGGLLALLVILRLLKHYENIKKEDIYNLAFYWIIFAVLGGRLYYVIYSWNFYSENLSEIFKIWQGGLAVHGVMLGGFVATYVFCKKKQINFWRLADIIAVGFVLAQVVGRWGNYFNQEIFGKPTELPWGLPIDVYKRPIEYVLNEYFHPTFLYESLGNLIIFCDLLTLQFIKIKRKPKFLFDGAIFLYYLIAYSMLRFLLEFVRIDQSPLVFGIRWAQIWSVILIIAAIAVMVFLYKKQRIRGQNENSKVSLPNLK